MRSEIHAAALRAAAKVAFSVAFLAGCDDPDEGTANGDSPEGCTVAPKSDRQSQVAAAKQTKQPMPLADGCATDEDASAPEPDCSEVVDAAFPTEGDYPGEKQSVSAEVQACCAELLTTAADSPLIDHRWDCCANLNEDQAAAIGTACTPWGPPVPPAMGGARARRSLPGVA